MTKFSKAKSKIMIFISLIILLITLTTAYAADETLYIENDTTNTITDDNLDLQNTESTQTDTIDESDNTQHYDEIVYLTEENVYDYDGYEYEANTCIIINETLSNVDFDIENENITIIGLNNASLINSHILVYENNFHLANISMITNDETEFPIAIELFSDNNIIENCNFSDIRERYDYEYLTVIEINSNNNTIINNDFVARYPSMDVDWEFYTGNRVSVVIKIYGDYNNISYNKFNVTESEHIDYPFGTLETMHISGSHNTITFNLIDMLGTLFTYGMTCFYDFNNISNNNISVLSSRYANGISVDGICSNCTVKDNIINVTTGNTELDPELGVDSAYGVIIIEGGYHGYKYKVPDSKTVSNTIEGNTITGYSSQMYGIEQFGGVSTRIINNNINITGKSTMGIGVIGLDTQIINNTVSVIGTTNETFTSPDYLSPQTTGVYSFFGTNTTISGNNIFSTYGTAVTIENEENALVDGNNMHVTNNEMSIITKGRTNTSTFSNNYINIANQNSIDVKDNSVINNYNPNYDKKEEEIIDNTTEDENNTKIEDNETEDENKTTENSTVIPEDNNIEEENKTTENNTQNNTTIIEDKDENQNKTIIVPIPENTNKTENTTKTNTTTQEDTELVDDSAGEDETEEPETNEADNSQEPAQVGDNSATVAPPKKIEARPAQPSNVKVFEAIQKTKEDLTDLDFELLVFICIILILSFGYGFLRGND